jgi:hypothetical protein
VRMTPLIATPRPPARPGVKDEPSHTTLGLLNVVGRASRSTTWLHVVVLAVVVVARSPRRT